MQLQRIFLIGYRGTGKSTVGQLLADRLGWSFADCDDHIEAAANCSIASIFANEGEAGFREREARVLRDLGSRDRIVVATGGGVVLHPGNREYLSASGFVVWLTATPETVWARLQLDPTTAARRPSLTALGGLDEVRSLMAAREPLYRSTAHFTTDANDPSPEAVVAAILKAWPGSLISQSSSGA
jgi:shikimate kinase